MSLSIMVISYIGIVEIGYSSFGRTSTSDIFHVESTNKSYMEQIMVVKMYHEKSKEKSLSLLKSQ
jgi:hypothetical protein